MCLPNEGVCGKLASFSCWLGCGSRCVNNALISKKAAQRAVGPNSDIDPDSSAHHRHHTRHTSPLCSLLSRGHSLQFRVCPGIIFLPNVLLVPALTAEPKFTASLIRIMGQWAPSVVTCLQNEPRNGCRMWDEMA